LKFLSIIFALLGH